ncbi:phosphotransferase [Spirillospora sp. CA-142024]|uniref:phosphotransferase n=1 Tax=Spirillospora sp. CA-142024 TaxID=3240036 RepID=UPI003D8BF119
MKGKAVSLDRLASVFRKMRDQKSENDSLPSLVDWLRSRLDDESLSDLAPGRSQAPRSERRRATAILEDLGSDVSGMVCHGDASSRNILLGPDEQLMLIDPRGINGDVCYDVAVAAWKTASDAPLRDRAAELARLVGVDTDRVHAWLFVADAARV